ncbi:MAG TPA: SPOR domain-containing protein [Candidatus Marinimicrobia bacterium]|nr:SPOR domain-containing protein [Candidatus Neomarinimicrobiota bacterium]HRS51300.1 SPOR domain-containing protein [Candidatus Neomarinimicrobiota bacterium]HRU91462.1 SPOR domain-containing protein [Candidatus Neomarinimicrobiota bacterium]
MRRFIFLALIPVFIFAQNLGEQKQKINAGEIDSVKILLPALIAKYPDNPELLFISGMIETDGEAALLIYRDVLSRFPNSSVADDAFLKIIEYLYAKGLYSKTEKYASELIKTYPQSDLIDKAVYLRLCSLNALHQRDSVDYYYKYYSAQYPNLDFHFENYQIASKRSTVESGEKFQPTGSQKTAQPAFSPAVEKSEPGNFTLQMGVFGEMANARELRNKLERLGYSVTFRQVERAGRKLTAVLVGSFKTEDEARAVGNKLKRDHNLDFIVVKQ